MFKKILAALVVALLLGCSVAFAEYSGPAPAQLIAFIFSIASNSTTFIVTGGGGSNQNSAIVTPIGGVLSNMLLKTANAPGTGNSFIATLYVGTAGAMTATGVTCTIANSAVSCQDSTHSAAVAAGQAWAIQVVASASATASGNSSAALTFWP